jgi:hypothetical protein
VVTRRKTDALADPKVLANVARLCVRGAIGRRER